MTYLLWSGSIPSSSENFLRGSWSMTFLEAPGGGGGGMWANAGLIIMRSHTPQHAQQQRMTPKLERMTWMTMRARHILYRWGAVDGLYWKVSVWERDYTRGREREGRRTHSLPLASNVHTIPEKNKINKDWWEKEILSQALPAMNHPNHNASNNLWVK